MLTGCTVNITPVIDALPSPPVSSSQLQSAQEGLLSGSGEEGQPAEDDRPILEERPAVIKPGGTLRVPSTLTPTPEPTPTPAATSKPTQAPAPTATPTPEPSPEPTSLPEPPAPPEPTSDPEPTPTTIKVPTLEPTSTPEDGSLTHWPLKGIDVSVYQDAINWSNVRDAGIDFAMARIGYRGSTSGNLYTDSMFHSYSRGATAMGLRFGGYFFSQAVTVEEAVEEAEYVLKVIEDCNITYPIAFDTEGSGGRADGLTQGQRTAIADAFCKTIAAAGYTPMIYASTWWWQNKLDTSSLPYMRWVAQHVGGEPEMSYYIWQYTSSGRVSGVNGNVDINYSYLR